jgi:hypothetical protein
MCVAKLMDMLSRVAVAELILASVRDETRNEANNTSRPS